MQRMHWDLFAHIGEDEWKRELEAISAAVPALTEVGIRNRLRRLIARVGDGHTVMRSYPEGAATARFPLELFLFRDGLYVIGAPRALAELVGGRVRALGPVPVERALVEMKPYLSVDNEMGYRDWASAALTSPDLLEALGAVPPEEPLDLELEYADGRRERTFVERVEQAPASFSPYGSLGRERAPGWVYANDSGAAEPLEAAAAQPAEAAAQPAEAAAQPAEAAAQPARATIAQAQPATPFSPPTASIAAGASGPAAETVGTTVDGGDSDLWKLVGDPAKPSTTASAAPAAKSSSATTALLTIFVAIVVVVLVLGFIYLFTSLL
jgi:hypothetical protein